MPAPPTISFKEAQQLILKGRKIRKLPKPQPSAEEKARWEREESERLSLESKHLISEHNSHVENRRIRENALREDLDFYKTKQVNKRNYSDANHSENLVNPDIIAQEINKNPYFKYPDLPIYEKREEILSIVSKYDVSVISGTTGSGKSLLIPQLILDDCYNKGKPCKIIITQPRRIAAISIAKYVAHIRGWRLGGLVGYKVSMDKVTSAETAITYATTGILVSTLASQKNLDSFSHIVIDEVHERDQNIDFALLLAKKLYRSVSPNTKIIIMSATMNCHVFAEYFQIFNCGVLVNAPVLEVVKNPYDITVYYEDDLGFCQGFNPGDTLTIEDQLSEKKMNYVNDILEFIEQAEREELINDISNSTFMNGSVLIFLPGLNEIENLHNVISQKNSGKLEIIRLHSQISLDEQTKAFEKVADGKRKVIIATNIAESSITVPDIAYVIDFCLTKELTLDKTTNYCALQLSWASKASCDQRKGRAGRVRAGVVWRLCSRRFYHNNLDEYPLPEIKRCPLEQLILKTKILDMGEPRSILGLAIDPPDNHDIISSLNRLKELGGLIHKNSIYDGEITFLGEILSVLPIDVCLGKLVVLGFCFGLLNDCITVAGCLSLKSFFSYKLSEKMKTFKSKLYWSQNSQSDLLAHLNAFNSWMKMFNGCSSRKSREWCNQNSLIEKRLNDVKNFRVEIFKSLALKNIKEFTSYPGSLDDQSVKIELLKIIIAGSFYPNYFQMKPIDIEEAHKFSYGLSHFSSIVLRGFPMKNQIQYKRWVQDYASLFGAIKNIKFDYSKCIISFSHAYNLESKVPDAVKFALKDRMISKVINAFSSSRHPSEESVVEQSLASNQINAKPIPGHVQLPPSNIDQIDIIITEIISPCMYWAQYASQNFQSALNSLQEKINRFRASDFTNFSRVPIFGSKVLSPVENDARNDQIYYRAIVISKNTNSNQVGLFFSDYGWKKSISYTLLKIPSDEILELSNQCFQVKLSECETSKKLIMDRDTLNNSISKLKSLVTEYKIVAKIESIIDSVINAELLFINDKQNAIFKLSDELLKENVIEKVGTIYLETNGNINRNNPNNNTDIAYNEDQGVDYEIKLNGPFSPIETKFMSVHTCGFYSNQVKISPLSVNCVVLDETCGTNDPLPVMVSCQVKSSGSGLSCDETTIISNHENLIPYFILIFAPQFKLFYKLGSNEVEGILGGVGYDLPSDINISVTSPIKKETITLCEGIKFFIENLLKPSDDKIGDRRLASDALSIQEKQKKIIELVTKLLSIQNEVKHNFSSDSDFERVTIELGNYNWN